MKEACLVQGLVSLDAALEGSKQGRSGACFVYRFSIISENNTPMYPIWQCADGLDWRRGIGSLARREGGASLAG